MCKKNTGFDPNLSTLATCTSQNVLTHFFLNYFNNNKINKT